MMCRSKEEGELAVAYISGRRTEDDDEGGPGLEFRGYSIGEGEYWREPVGLGTSRGICSLLQDLISSPRRGNDFRQPNCNFVMQIIGEV
jgi:hypothetical protein